MPDRIVIHYSIKCLPGVLHIWKEHVRVSWTGPGQFVPLFTCGGLLHDRLRCWVPLPHVTLHSDQEDQSKNRSATANIWNSRFADVQFYSFLSLILFSRMGTVIHCENGNQGSAKFYFQEWQRLFIVKTMSTLSRPHLIGTRPCFLSGSFALFSTFYRSELEHVRLHCWVPLPHVTLHWDQEDQFECN